MWYLLQLEWKKFKHYRTFKVMAILYVILLPLMLIVGKSFFNFADAPLEVINTETMFKLPGVWDYLAYIGNWLSFFFLGFMGVLCITMEFDNKTLRQNIITGVTRNEFFLAKILLILTISLFATLYFALVGFSFGFINTDNLYYTKIVSGTKQIPLFYLMCVGYMTFGFFLGVLIRKTGLALFLYLIYVIFLEPVIRWAAHGKIVMNKTIHYYPLNAIEDLAPIPIPKIINQLTKEHEFSLLLTSMEATTITLIYLFIFIFIAYWRIKKSDL
ncbi:MAG: ABC-2 type transport system permease protein [Saprospiraceae bacterium]|jgi:ABC-2 type transport system permease protein